MIPFLAGLGAALAGQTLGHSLTTRRERRADFVTALDKAVSAFASGEGVLDDLADAIERGSGDLELVGTRDFPPFVHEAMARTDRTQVEMRAALFAIQVRVKTGDSPVFVAFGDAFREWEMGFLKARIMVHEVEPDEEELREARGHAQTFRGQFYDVAIARAAGAVGQVKA